MSPITLLVVAVGVSADAFAVSTARGVTVRRGAIGSAFALAATFGFFQAAMPLIGWLVGVRVAVYFNQVDHWVALGLLGYLGGRMVREAFSGAHDDNAGVARTLGWRELLVLGIATSIDALAVGGSLALIPVNIGLAVGVIGVTTFALSFLGVQIGQRGGTRFGTVAQVVGGLVLIGIGAQIFYEHFTSGTDIFRALI